MKIKYIPAVIILLSLLTVSAAMNIFHAVASGKGGALPPGANGNPQHPKGGSIPDGTDGWSASGRNPKQYGNPDGSAVRMTNPGASRRQGATGTNRLTEFEKEYGAFFSKYPMSEEKKNLICAALARDLETIRNVMRQGGMNRNVDPAIRRANLDARRRQFESDLREPLGDEVFEALVYYRDTKPCRELAGSISEQMKESGCELDAEDVDKMVRLFKDNGVMLANEHIRSRAPGIAKASARMLSAKEEVIIKEAGDFLSPRQMDVLKQIWSGLTGNEGRQVANKK